MALLSINTLTRASRTRAVVNSSSSSHNARHTTAAPGVITKVSLQPSSPLSTGLVDDPDSDMDQFDTRKDATEDTQALRGVVVGCFTKILAAVSQSSSPSPPAPPHALPENRSTDTIGPALLISGFVAAAPAHEIHPPSTLIATIPDNNMDLSKAKSILRVLSALGDGFTGVPGLKGAAELGLQIADILEVSVENEQRSSANTHCCAFVHRYRMHSQTKVTARNWRSGFVTF